MSNISISIDTQGLVKLQTALSEAEQIAIRTGMKTLESIAREIIEESELEVPIDTGTLFISTFITLAGQSVVFGYGGTNDQVNPKTKLTASQYMLYVHEDLSAVHPHGKAKFFEDPLFRRLAGISQELKEALAAALKAQLGG